MKKILAVVVAIVTLVGCGDHSKIEKQIKSTIKKEAKLNGVSVRFNSIEIEDSDTIPYYYTNWWELRMDSIDLIYEIACDSFDIKYAEEDVEDALMNGREFNIEIAKELLKHYQEGLEEDINRLKNVEEELKIIEKSHKNPCYIVYCDCLCKVGNLPVRVQPTYVFIKENGKFKCIYESKKFQDLIK